MPNLCICFAYLLIISANFILPTRGWADAPPPLNSILDNLSLHEKVAQIFMVGFNGVELRPSLARLLKDVPAGGVILYNQNMRQGPSQVRSMTTALFEYSLTTKPNIPLLIATDLEGGVVKRIERNFSHVPATRDLGSIKDPKVIEKLSNLLASQLLAYGINMNLAPVLEIQSGVLGSRIFADNESQVTKAGVAYITGMQKAGVITTAKHFPTVGPQDPHQEFGIISKQLPSLKTTEFLPFTQAIKHNVAAIMPAFAYLEGLHERPELIATCPDIVTGLLKQEMKFNGMVISDDVLMSNETHKPILLKTLPLKEAVVKLVQAGIDMVMISDASLLRQATAAIEEAIADGRIPLTRLNDAVSRIVSTKYQFGLFDNDYAKKCDAEFARLPSLIETFDSVYQISTHGLP